MDRNTIIGLVIIIGILIGYNILTTPTKEEQEAFKRKQDSLIEIEQKALREKEIKE